MAPQQPGEPVHPDAPSGFAREADMLDPLRRGRSAVVATHVGDLEWLTLFEVPSFSGVVDVLHVAYDATVMAKRKDQITPPLTDWYDLMVFVALQHRVERGLLVNDLAKRVGLTPAGVRRGSLTRLAATGHIERTDNGRFRVTWRYSSPVRVFVAIEAKRRDWRRAISQAFRYTSFADRTYVALEPAAAYRAAQHEDMLATAGIGVLGVNPHSLHVKRTVDAPQIPDRLQPLERAFVVEQVVHLVRTGTLSGPILPVFGQLLMASSGADPRVAN